MGSRPAARSAEPIAAERREPAGRRLRRVLVLGGLSAFAPLSIDMYLPGLPGVARDLGTGAAQVQLTLTACVIGLAAGQAVAGPISDSVGRRRPLLLGLAAYTAASLACAAAPSVGALIALRLVQGAAGAAGIVISRAVVRDLRSGTAMARLFARLLLVNGLAPILAPVVGAQLLRVTSWRGVFVVLAGIGALLLVAAAAALPESLPPQRRRPGGVLLTAATFTRLLRERAFAGYALANGLAFAAMFAYISGSPFVLEGVYGLSPQLFSAVFATNALGIVVAGQAGARLVGRVPPARLLGAGLAVSATGGVALLVAAGAGLGLAGVLPALFAVVASVGLVIPNANALALAGHPREAGSASALVGLAQFVIGGSTAPLVGVAGTASALPMSVVIAALSLAAPATYLALARRRRAPITP